MADPHWKTATFVYIFCFFLLADSLVSSAGLISRMKRQGGVAPPALSCINVCDLTFLKNCDDGMLCVFNYATCRPDCIEPSSATAASSENESTTKPTSSVTTVNLSLASSTGQPTSTTATTVVPTGAFTPPPVACLDECAMTFLKSCEDGLLCVFDYSTYKPNCIQPPSPTSTTGSDHYNSTPSATQAGQIDSDIPGQTQSASITTARATVPFTPPPVSCLDVCAMPFLKNCDDGMLCQFDFSTCRPNCIPMPTTSSPTPSETTQSRNTEKPTSTTDGDSAAPCYNLCSQPFLNPCEDDTECVFDEATCRVDCIPVTDASSTSASVIPTTSKFSYCDGPCLEGMCAFYAGINRYTCICFDGFIGDDCGQVCDLSCGDQNHCDINDEGEMHCVSGPPRVTIPAILRNNTQVRDLTPPPIDKKCGRCNHGDCILVPEVGGYQCACHENYTGADCSDFCNLTCANGGNCVVVSDGMRCSCHPNFTGPLCNKPKPSNSTLATAVIQVQSTPDWLWYIVTACILLLILLIVVAVVMPLYLWKHRNILILKIVYYLKPYEDDDEKKYDAFVSFKGRTEDEAFVYRTLALRLENEMNFKLCLHDRDFIPGEYISDQIIDAIDNSRRTILILSPDYCNSEWTKFEYHRAREEMLRNKTRIIPIMYKDISSIEDIDPTLNELLRSITYITWPGFASDVANKHELEAIDDKKARKEEERRQKEEERFWRKVHLTMPKKHKNSSTEPLPSDSCTVPLSPISNGKINSGFTSNDETPSVPLSDIRTSPEDLSEINVIVANGKTSKNEDVDSSSTIPSSNGFLHNNVKSIDFPLSPACEKQNGHHQNGLTISA